MKSFVSLALISAVAALPQKGGDFLQGLGPAIAAIGPDAMMALVGGGDLTPAYTAGTLTADKIGEFTKLLPPSILSSAATGFVQNVFNKGYGRAGAAKMNITSNVPDYQPLTPRQSASVPESKTVKIRYGPYLVPGMPAPLKPGEKRIKHGIELGTLWNYPDLQVQRASRSPHVIVGMNAGLEDANGNTLNVDKGAWLHHFVLFNQGPGRVDATCTGHPSVPHFAIGSTPEKSERLFSSGNERTPAFMASWQGASTAEQKLVGYHMGSNDVLSLIVDLMNENREDQAYWLTITYDYVDKADGHDLSKYDDMRPIWFDADLCGISEVAPKAQDGAYDISQAPWRSTVEGEILGFAGHLHDGGQTVTLTADGKDVCTSSATYGATNAYKNNAATMEAMAMKGATVHISNMTICQGDNLGGESNRYMKKGQLWGLNAHYDYKKDAGMLEEDGTQAPVMGIAIMYVRQPYRGKD